jgi:hypothetical protein
MKTTNHSDAQQPELPSLEHDGGDSPQAWELIDVGRYRPRRIRGSCVGRELG